MQFETADDHDIPLLASDGALGAPRLDDSAGRQRHGRELGGRFGQQGPLLRGPNGGDVVDQPFQIPPRRGTCVEDDRQLLRLAGEGAQPLLEGGQEIGKGPFAARGASPGQDGGEERFPDRQSIADLDASRGERRVDAAGQVDFRGEVVEGGDGAGADGGDWEGGGVLALVEFEDVIDAA